MIRHNPIAGGGLQPAEPSPLSRRGWIAGIVAGLTSMPIMSRVMAWQATGRDPALADEIAQIQAIATKAGLGRFSSFDSKHFLAVGDAPRDFQRAALGICESLAQAFLAYFNSKGMKLAFPARPMTVITLKDDAAYHAYIGEDPGDEIGGHYDLDTNRLVMFDFRPKKAALAADAELVNRITLIHETTHLLSFNMGMLSRKTDVPTCISEGLATFVELWRPKSKDRLGATNIPRLQMLTQPQADQPSWIPISELLSRDELCQDPKTAQLAYTESWLLVHYLIRTPGRLPKFREYLAGIPESAGAAKRLAYAEAKLGSLEALDQEVRAHARRLQRVVGLRGRGGDPLAQPRTGFSPMFLRISARCFS